MNSLKLFFEGFVPELVRIEFDHPLLGISRTSIRGRGANSSSDDYSFPWSNAVKGLCELIVQWGLSHHSNTYEARVEGHKGSLAASLDLAITKQPRWITEIFGSDSRGHSLLRRLISRKNTELRHPGPVVIQITETVRRSFLLQIFLNNIPCHDETSLKQLCLKENLSQKTNPLGQRSLFESFSKEVSWSLRAIDIFKEDWSRTLGNKLWANTSFSHFAGRKRELVIEKDLRLSSAAFLGLHKNSFGNYALERKGTPCKIATPGSCLGALAVLENLKEISYGTIEHDYLFAHGGEVLSAVLNRPDEYQGAVLTLGQLAHVMSLGECAPIVPLIVLPPTSFEVLMPGSAKVARSCEWAFLDEGATSSRIAFDELMRSIKNKGKTTIRHCPPSNLLAAATNPSENLRVLTWFPFSMIVKDLTGMKQSPVFASQQLAKENFLCVRRELLRDKHLLNLLDYGIRESWLNLLESPAAFSECINKIANSQLYPKALRRWAGMHSIDPQKIKTDATSGL